MLDNRNSVWTRLASRALTLLALSLAGRSDAQSVRLSLQSDDQLPTTVVALSPKDTYLASVNFARLITVNTQAEGRIVREFVAAHGRVVRLEFSVDERRLLVVSEPTNPFDASTPGSTDPAVDLSITRTVETCQIFNLTSGAEEKAFPNANGNRHWCGFSSDGRRVFVATRTGTVLDWDLVSGKGTELGTGLGHLTTLAVSPKGSFLAVGVSDGTVLSWTLSRTGATPVALPRHPMTITTLTFAADDATLASGSRGGLVTLTSLVTGHRSWACSIDFAVSRLALAPERNVLAVGGQQGAIALLSVEGCEVRWRRSIGSASRSAVHTLAFDKTGEHLIGQAAKATLFDVATGGSQRRDLWAAQFSADGARMFYSTERSTVVQEIATGQIIRRLEAHTVPPQSLVASPREPVIAVASSRFAHLIDLSRGSVSRFGPHDDVVNAVALSMDGTRLVTAAEDHTWRLWETITGRQIAHGTASKPLNAVALSDDGRLIAAADEDAVSIWNDQEQRLGPLPKVTTQDPDGANVDHGSPETIAFVANQSEVAVSFDLSSVFVFDAKTRRLKRPHKEFSKLSRSRGYVLGTAFDPLVAGAVFDPAPLRVSASTQLASLNTNFNKRLPGLHSYSEFDVSPQERYLAGVTLDGYLELWDLTAMTVRVVDAPMLPGSSVAFSSDEQWVLATDARMLRAWRTADASAAVAVAFDDVGNWAAVSEGSGQFDTNQPEFALGLHWVLADPAAAPPLITAPINIFLREYYSPKLLARAFRNELKSDLARPVATLNRATPLVEIVSIQQAPESNTVTVRLRVTSQGIREGDSPREGGVYDVRLFRDGQLVTAIGASGQGVIGKVARDLDFEHWRARNMVAATGTKELVVEDILVPQRAGVSSTTFVAYAFNRDRVKGEASQPVVHKLASRKSSTPRAYVIAFGVNANQSGWDLTSAVPSARRAADIWTAMLKSSYSVTTIVLDADVGTDGKIASRLASKRNLESVLEILGGHEDMISPDVRKEIDPEHKLRRATPDDAIVLYVASHGHYDPRGQFYLVPYDTPTRPGIDDDLLRLCAAETGRPRSCTDADAFLAAAISGDELEAWSRDVNAREFVVMIDACYAGGLVGVGSGPLGDSGFGQMAFDKAMRVVTAAQVDSPSQGTVLVRTLEALANKATELGIAPLLRSVESQAAPTTRDMGQQSRGSGQRPEFVDFAVDAATRYIRPR
jgi:WD40 repeat protein